jgi:hypothetical protein
MKRYATGIALIAGFGQILGCLNDDFSMPKRHAVPSIESCTWYRENNPEGVQFQLNFHANGKYDLAGGGSGDSFYGDYFTQNEEIILDYEIEDASAEFTATIIKYAYSIDFDILTLRCISDVNSRRSSMLDGDWHPLYI